MRRFLLLLALATVCSANCPSSAISGFRNTEWIPNNVVIKISNFFYDSIALTSEDQCSPAKRFVSVFTLVKMIFLTTNSADWAKGIAIARQKATKNLQNSAAAIAGTFRGVVDRILNIIDQMTKKRGDQVVPVMPINDIITNCPPDAYEGECQKALNETRSQKEKLCNGYSKHVAIHSRISKWSTSQSSIDYIDEMINRSKKTCNDTAILDFFENLATVKYRSMFEELRGIIMSVKTGIFNCNVLTFAKSPCA